MQRLNPHQEQLLGRLVWLALHTGNREQTTCLRHAIAFSLPDDVVEVVADAFEQAGPSRSAVE